MTPYESHLRPDGTVFPPVTPDPPTPPGQEEILVPELDPSAVERAERRAEEARRSTEEDAGAEPSLS